ncbi:serine/threonine protein kinase [Microbacterium sp. SORGH_AS_0888]|uniref:serine/threonine protein kinase n=1 Tax=Microbacterium sp. SORGH_AS_0888 TaxID=3041791 RepID=UPI00277D4393|nr:PASTA domain-containing protein [Microbacterium sp. SORGH_AS_0888]MDQ1129044.1 serine/threonine protein kinase [Microbacterium sp. SORGH_AS_0888]
MIDGLVAGRFAIRRLLGSGGTAAVFAAWDQQRGHEVALKLLHPHLADDPRVWDAFFEEVGAAQSISHPALAEVYDAGADEQRPPVVWIAMELVRGVTLADHVAAQGPLATADAVTLADRLLAALAAAHEGGVVHRDLTPANVMFDPDARGDVGRFGDSVRLLDFGLADVPGRSTIGADALLSDTAAPAGVVASAPYASPEQLSGAAVTEASDIYQAGATLYFAVTGQAPFSGTTAEIVRAHLSAPPPVPSVRRRRIGRDWDRVLTTAMLKRPGDRYSSAAAMAAALPRATTDASAVTAPVAPAPAETGLTRVYRTNLPEVASPVSGPPAGYERTRGSRWPIWAATITGAAAIVGVIALSATAGSAPSPVPTASVSLALPSPTASREPTPTAAALVTVPVLSGLSLADATSQLTRNGLTTGAITRVSAALAADTVISSEPAAGVPRPAGSSVALQVASGSNAVPPVVGQTVADATAALTAAGFAAVVSETGGGTPDTVTASSVAAGQVLAIGSTIVLSTPPRPPVVTPTPAPTASPSRTATPTPSGTATP